ncbi:MAG: P13 family porin [Treponemataceae bacterium]|nr:P13 family porin [Treponemataceae bacterium]
MKKFVLVIALALIAGFCFAQGVDNFQADVYSPSFQHQITPLSARSVYAEDPLIPFLLNFFLGWGIGSFVQGDTTGGVTAILGDVLSEGVVVAGYLLIVSGSLSEVGIGLAVGGALSLMAFRIYECVRPFTYSNKNLAFLNDESSIHNLAISPVIDIEDKNYGLSVSMKI